MCRRRSSSRRLDTHQKAFGAVPQASGSIGSPHASNKPAPFASFPFVRFVWIGRDCAAYVGWSTKRLSPANNRCHGGL